MLLNNQNTGLGKDGQLNAVDVSNVGSPVQVGCPVLPRADADMIMKVSFLLLHLDLRKLIVLASIVRIFVNFKLPIYICLYE